MKPISDDFVRQLEAYAKQQGVPLIPFEKGQRKDDVAAEHRQRFTKSEGVVFIGKAQEKAPVFRTEQRTNPETGRKYPWIVRSTAMVNQFYIYGMDEDFGPFFLKFSSYFPYNAKLCINGHEYVKRQLTKEGVYDFSADLQVVRVYEGRAIVTQGDQHVDLKTDRQVALNQPLKSQKFDRGAVENSDPLYAWSKLRSEYLSDATASTAQTYLVDGGSWYGAGWYWNPYWAMYSFIPGDGFFYNPFGFGLYSPLYAGLYGGRFYGGRGFYGHPAARGSITRSAPLAMRSGGGFGGGGFHGGGGGGGHR